MTRRIQLRSFVSHDGDRFAVTYISRRPRLGRGLFCVLEHPRRGLKIVRYSEVAENARKQNRSPERIAQVTHPRSKHVETGNAV